MHGRAKRAASGLRVDLRGWVRRWSANLGLKWTDDEVDDVTAYLNARYYRFACPPPDCKATRKPRGRAVARLALDGPAPLKVP